MVRPSSGDGATAHHPPQASRQSRSAHAVKTARAQYYFFLLTDFYRLSTVSFGFPELVEKLSQLSIVKSNDSDERG